MARWGTCSFTLIAPSGCGIKVAEAPGWLSRILTVALKAAGDGFARR